MHNKTLTLSAGKADAKTLVLEKLERAQKEVNRLRKLSALCDRYPDMKRVTCRWEHVYYCTREVNELVTDCDILHDCGCCDDSPLMCRPWAMIDGQKIYSDPYKFHIGQGNAYGYYGEEPWDGWVEQMKEAGIAQVVIDKAEKYLADHPPVYPQDDECEGDEL